MREATAIKRIEEHGILLVFPLANRPEPASLWSVAYPGSPMRWDWSENADPRVAETWHLRERLARTTEVVYAKWFRGRATFFSRPVFRAMLAALAAEGELLEGLPPEARAILEVLEDNSPESVKSVRAQVELQGRHNERLFQGALKALWTRLLIVGAGEVDDGAFPSLAIGATSLLFEDLWRARLQPDPDDARRLAELLGKSKSFAREFERSRKSVASRGRRPLPRDE